MLSGGAEESTEKASQDFQGQKVSSHYVDMTLGRFITCYSNSACKQPLFVLASFWTDCYSMKGSMKTPQVGIKHHPSAFRIVVNCQALVSSRFRCNCFFRK